MLKWVNRAIRLLDGVLGAVMIAAAALLLFISVYSLMDNIRLYRGAADASLLTYKPPLDTPIRETEKISDKQAAWLYIEHTGIDYPVMQGADNYEFLNRDPYGAFKLSGAIFLDFRNSKDFSDDYSMIYGHHMEHGAMFGSLDYFTDPSYFTEHSRGVLVTEEASYTLELFAVAYAPGDETALFSPRRTTRANVLDYISKHALINTGCDENARIVALSTCAGETALSRLIVFGCIK